jgi:uncharacterized integral membrane protein (TIGR00697 family)
MMTELELPYPPRASTAMVVVLGAYVAGLVVANAVAAKLVFVAGGVFTAGALAYPVTFVLQDVISERWGQRVARASIAAGFVACAVLVLYSFTVLHMPGVDPEASAAYARMFAPTPRIVLGSLAAYTIGSLVDVRVFFWIRAQTGRPHLWLRKLGSTVVSQLVDSLVFVAIAFGGEMPVAALLAMAFYQYAFKVACMVVGTPVSYALLRGV